jgi:uncharacterized protein (TIGR02599 family)
MPNTPNPRKKMQFKAKSQSPAGKVRQAFTLIELLVSMAVLSLLMVMVFQMVDQTQKTWNVARTRVSQFREARAAFEAVTRSLTQATLNTYYDYDYGGGKSETSVSSPQVPQGYQRQSELHFISGPSTDIIGTSSNRPGHSIFFQMPGGFGTKVETEAFSDLINTRGYFVEYGNDSAFKPAFLNSETKPRYRFRLMELRQPTESMLIYNDKLRDMGTDGINANVVELRRWIKDAVTDEADGEAVKRPLADNIIAAFFLPKYPGDNVGEVLAPDYIYDSRLWQQGNSSPEAKYSKHQMPPLVEVTMVAVDEKSMIRYQQLNKGSEKQMPDFVPDDLFSEYTGYQKFLDDLETLKGTLDSKKIDYRVFNQTVPMRGSGWSPSI